MKLYNPVHDRFERFCRARVYGDMEHKDLMNETILIAFEKIDSLKNHESFLYFLFGISVRILANSKRKLKPKQFVNEHEMLNIEDMGNNTDKGAEVRLLHEALSLLPEEQKEALILF